VKGSGRAQGQVHYVARPRAGLPTGTAIRHIDRVRFDFG